jgi:hypothetical protein
MSQYAFWTTVAIRVNQIMALKRIHEKTDDPEDKPARVVSKLVIAHVMKKAKKLDIDLSDIFEPAEK